MRLPWQKSSGSTEVGPRLFSLTIEGEVQEFWVDQSPERVAEYVADYLKHMNGERPSALTVHALPPGAKRPDVEPPDDPSSRLYIQVAGSAEAMTVEVCAPDGRRGVVLATVGRSKVIDNDDWVDIAFMGGESHVRIHPDEVHTAEHATRVVRRWIIDAVVPDAALLRPLEWWPS